VSAPAPAWRFLVDENLPRSLVSDLVALGHTASHVYDLGMGGAKDLIVWARAQIGTWTIITGDKDFATILAYPPPHASIIVVEVPDTLPPDHRKQLILRQLATMAGQSLADTLVILESGRVRIRQ
jgi:predicted nuclease of predicted toxin-antitoxin system